MIPTVLFFLTALVWAFVEVSANQSPASGAFNCSLYDRQQWQDNGKGCLANMENNPGLYEKCRDSSDSICYIFLQEPPFINLHKVENFNASKEAFQLQKPFKCGQFKESLKEVGGVSGIAFETHKLTSSRDDWCMWGGHADHCTFNQLVDYIDIKADEKYRFAVTGLLLETPQRQCKHHPSAPLVDNEMMIIGKSDPQFRSSRGPLDQLIRPFEKGAWATFIGLVLFAFCMSLVMAIRFHWSAKRSIVSACFIFAGNWEVVRPEEGDPEDSASTTSISSDMQNNIAKNTRVAVVNFLFQNQQQSLSKPVKRLTPSQLKNFVVLKNSALENVWDETVSAGKQDWPQGIHWKQCPTATECIEDVQDCAADFMVTFEIVGKHLLSAHSSCDQLTVHQTRDVLYQFNGGWLYNMAVNETRRLQVDRELVGLRIDGRARELQEDALEEYKCESSGSSMNISTMTVLIPCLIFVVPPLVLSLLVLMFWDYCISHRKK